MRRTSVLLADDEETLRTNLAQVLSEEGYEVIACPDGSAALRALRNQRVDSVITDLRMPGITGMDLIDHVTKLAPEAPIIVITAFGEVETAVEAMKKGARDYICKPLIFDELIFKLKQLLAHRHLAKENKQLREQIRRSLPQMTMVGESQAMHSIRDTIRRIAHTTSNVLISGDSGTGKEVVAHALHDSAVTKDRPFVAVNCGGLAESLVESELFGYRRGAFTGADADHTGYFEAADGGTLFLDEIGNLPLPSQAVLLRAIEQKAVTRVGDHRPRPVDIRIVAATNQHLEKAIDSGTFREDLYFRLNVIRIVVPPLRERRDDIPVLMQHFVEKYNAELKGDCPGFSEDAIATMSSQPWRGNVRELENVVERALIFSGNERVELENLSVILGTNLPTRPYAEDLRSATREFERQHIIKTLVKNAKNKVATASALGIGLSSLYRKMEELDIGREADDKPSAPGTSVRTEEPK